jgi:hypothetical protein
VDNPLITTITTPMLRIINEMIRMKLKYFSDEAYNIKSIGIIEIPMVLVIADKLKMYSSTVDVISKIFPMYFNDTYFTTEKNVNKKMSMTIEKLFCNTECG